MPINLPGVPFKLTPQDMGGFDVGDALKQGFNLNKQFQEARTMPKKLAEELLAKQLQNKINQPKADYAKDITLADLEHTRSGTGLQNIQTQTANAKLQHYKDFQNLLSGGSPNQSSGYRDQIKGTGKPGYMTPHGFEGSMTGIPAESNYSNNGPDREAEKEAIARIDAANNQNTQGNSESFIPSFKSSLNENLNQGLQNKPTNSELERLKWIWDNQPQYRKDIKGLGVDFDKGEGKLTGIAKNAESMKLLADKYGKDSEVYKNAQAERKAEIQRKEDLSDIRHRQLNGLKPGDTEIKDPKTGDTIGFNKQTTDKQKEFAKNTILFNELYPLVYKGASILSGPGATARLEQAARTYKTNPASKKLIDDFLIADKAATTTAVTEAARFGAGKTNQTFNRFVETLKAEDIHPKLKKWIKEFEIPYEANLTAGIRWQNELNKAEKKANKNIPATMPYYFDPEKQFEHEQEQMNSQKDESNSDNDPLGIR